ncbi:NADPH-dependent FMN reductase [Actinoplanes sp. NPDC051851]|uniref:NADPH-dependent FMN reductase n=1 Tax=Actinoplanes sp. NPDC051851 TaxID=3154753 RepID=UPI00343EA9EC
MTCVLLISGNIRETSLHTAALRTAARFAPAEVTAVLWDGLAGMPAFVPGEPEPPRAVLDLRHRVATADAILISTPEYAGSLPGSLKNTLDWLVDGGDLRGKPSAWLSVVAPGQDEGARTTLESILEEHGGARLLRAACVRVPLEARSIDEHGLITEPRLHLALQDMLHALIRVMAMGDTRQRPSWQANSSLYPVINRPTDRPTFF